MTLGSVAEFKLSITKALADQLAEALDPLEPCPLKSENLNQLQDRPGVYVLFLDDSRVYVGKTAKALPERLSQHLKKISGRSKLSLDRMGFVCVYVDKDMDSIAPERMLIARYTSAGDVPWNNNGFGNKDPGRRRDHSLVKINHFDADYPINLDIPALLLNTRTSVSTTLATLKKMLPFNFRYDTGNKGKSIMKSSYVTIPSTATTFRSVIEEVIQALPAGWQATALPGYAILYREEDDVVYRSATGWWRKSLKDDAVWHPGPSQRDYSQEPIPSDAEIIPDVESPDDDS
ncbi:conserved hypothetical protein [Frankia canadensis]|uniref:GIY-YIG domain-containing protein n=1 Tax=Frankia canadensis TaxID=1836972 RepID=A0A2I2L274_9ACTN|nr:GIY-YIG nuclease family protein [Frankia canadensis]SNQ51967.1 conserved hypothetical protein [Frankia canadensis]SOU59257.1 conserved hypothetical protein [Frankia canadensis]